MTERINLNQEFAESLDRVLCKTEVRALKAKKEIGRIAEFARRSIGQKFRHIKRRICNG